LIKLKFAEHSTETFAKLMAAFILGGLLLLFLMSLSFFLGMTLSVLWGNYIAGFGVVAAFYFILFVLFLVFRKQLLELPLQNTAIKNLFIDEEKHEN
jgi:hypothetical protein